MKYVISAIGGLVVGVVFTIVIMLLLFFLFSAGSKPAVAGTPVQTPDEQSKAEANASVTLNEKFLAAALSSIFNDMNAPSFPIQASNLNTQPTTTALLQSGGCEGRVYLLTEGSGIKTTVRLQDGKAVAPIAFKGSYNVFGACVNFTGWADTKIDLRFDADKQTVFGQLSVETINLDGLLASVSGFLTPMIQDAINRHVNPIEILNAKQLALTIPIKNANGTLKAKVKDVRSEIKDGEVRIQIAYGFTGEKN